MAKLAGLEELVGELAEAHGGTYAYRYVEAGVDATFPRWQIDCPVFEGLDQIVEAKLGSW